MVPLLSKANRISLYALGSFYAIPVRCLNISFEQLLQPTTACAETRDSNLFLDF
jgi:hypothetical protein